jgi:SAM-dependent methyltransferase
VLEFGCHLGASAIVLAALGAEVTAIDVDESYVELARLNAERYGFADRIRVLHVPDTSRMPFPEAAFDVISCNSVLEYVPPEVLPAVQRDIDRVLAPGGTLIILGTSNRLWPLEAHSNRWMVSYVPRRWQRLVVGQRVESCTPWELRAGFPGYADLGLQDGGRLLLELKARMGAAGRRLAILRAANRLLVPLGAHVGFVSPTVTLLLQKPGAGAR